MESIVKKAKTQIEELEEKVYVTKTVTNAAGKKATAKVQVDTSDEANDSYTEASDIFSLFNRQSSLSSLRVDVKIDEDIEEDPSDAIAEGGEDTVYGQGSNPKPEDETYLSLLKKTAPQPKKIKINV